MKDFILSIKAKNPDLKLAEIRGLLYILNSKENLTNTELIRLTGIPKGVLKTFKSSLSSILKRTEKDEIELSEKGLEVLSLLDLRPYKWSLIEQGLTNEEDAIFKLRVKYDLAPKREYDQFFATPQSTVEKAKLLMDKGLVEDKEIAFIGDDDLVSIALAQMSPNYKKIKVFDVDNRILDLIEKIISDQGHKGITTKQHDVKKPFTPADLEKFDVVLIDPPYTISGAKLFLHRALELLKSRNDYEGSYVFFNYGTSLRNPDEITKLQQVINRYYLVIEDKLDKYTRYFGAETVGSSSSMYVLKTTPSTKTDNKVLQSKIYTFENTDTDKFPYVDHYVFKLQRISKETLTSRSKMEKIIGDICKRHRFNVKDMKVTKFKGQGFSFTYILATSNLVVHTWPEMNAVHIDLITCEPIHNKDLLAKTMADFFGTEFVDVICVE